MALEAHPIALQSTSKSENKNIELYGNRNMQTNFCPLERVTFIANITFII